MDFMQLIICVHSCWEAGYRAQPEKEINHSKPQSGGGSWHRVGELPSGLGAVRVQKPLKRRFLLAGLHASPRPRPPGPFGSLPRPSLLSSRGKDLGSRPVLSRARDSPHPTGTDPSAPPTPRCPVPAAQTNLTGERLCPAPASLAPRQ